MIRYPNGSPLPPQKERAKTTVTSVANRGMGLEDDINISNQYYNDQNIALITKRPTPINIVKVDYTHGARITDAYFEQQSTTDYNGVYKGRYLDFEAKSSNSKTSFPLSNISAHQIKHLKGVLFHGGIAFFIISFATLCEVYLLDAKFVIDFYEHGERKSIPLEVIKKEGVAIRQGYNPRLFYLEAVDKSYFK